MADVIVRGTAIRWVDDTFPGWIEVSLRADDGQTHRVIEKVPVLTELPLTAESKFPDELWLRGTSSRADETSVDVTLADDITTTDGLNGVTVGTNDVIWL